jgi:hypothetical protein
MYSRTASIQSLKQRQSVCPGTCRYMQAVPDSGENQDGCGLPLGQIVGDRLAGGSSLPCWMSFRGSGWILVIYLFKPLSDDLRQCPGVRTIADCASEFHSDIQANSMMIAFNDPFKIGISSHS